MASGTIINPDKVTYFSTTATPASGISIRNCTMRGIGKLFFGDLYFDVTSAISSGGDIATLDRSLPQPLGAYAVAAVVNSVGAPGMIYFTRTASNRIRAWSSLPVGNEYFAQFIYVIS